MAKKRRRGSDAPGPAGFLVVDKPAGCTSHDIVDLARGWFGIRKIGHLGTLDPQATGVLPLAIRGATKLVPFFQDCGKAYVGTIRFGATTNTLDGEGEILSRYDGPLPDERTVRSALESFVGEIEQIPPMFSAVKRGGVPLHKLARQGEEVEREPKKVVIERLEVIRFESPEVEIVVECGAGTYVRSLADDLGRVLGCGGYLASLRRLRSDPFDIAQAHTVEVCERAVESGGIEALLIPPATALGLPVVRLAVPAIERLDHGGDIAAGTLERSRAGSRVSGLDEDGQFVGILELRADRRLWPLRMIPRIEGGSDALRPD
jgi:tRNA pseudouridine55 synthase